MNKEMSEFYEQQLTTKFGVRFARNFRVNGLWDKGDTGEFCSLDGPAFNLQKTRPRLFTECPSQFTECRGVKLSAMGDGEEIALAARFVVFGVGSVPNSAPFADTVELNNRSGHVLVDDYLRTSDDNVYAMGDVAMMESLGKPNEHVWSAKNQAKYLAKTLLNNDGVQAYQETPMFYSRIMDNSWKFWGSVSKDGTIITVGIPKDAEESEEKKGEE